jgi:tetratricopeptide (TPR) repeat protein
MKTQQHRIIFIGLNLLLGASFCFAQTSEATHQQIQDHTRKAQAYLNEKRPDLAIPELQALVALDPQNVDAQANLGVLLFFRSDYVNAIPAMKAALKIQPDLAKIQGLLGIAEKNTGDSYDARNDLEKSFPQLQDEKFKRQVGLQLIELNSAAGDLDKAAVVVSQLRHSYPEDKEILYAAYRVYSDLAGESMLSLSIVDPNSAQMHQVMAHEEARQGNNSGAIAQYRKAYALDPHLPGIHFELAEALDAAGDIKLHEEALQEYLEAVKANPLDVKAQCRLGDIYAQKGDAARAQSYYVKAVAQQPENAEANLGLAKALLTLNQKKEALPILERAVQLDPTNAAAHYRLSVLYREEGRGEDAKRELDMFLKYREMKEKLRGIYKEMQIEDKHIHNDEKSEK